MKLLLCTECQYIFSIAMEERTCLCKKTKGVYLEDRWHAEYSGPSIPIGFANGSFIYALKSQPEKDWGKEFKAFIIQKECETFTKTDKKVAPTEGA